MIDEAIYFHCPISGTDRVTVVYQEIQAWVKSTALANLVKEFGEIVPTDMKTEALVAWLLDFSERWDFRKLQREAAAKDIGEGARWLLTDSNLTPAQHELIQQSSRTLGLLGVGEPTGSNFDYVLVLGGARLSCQLRPRLASTVIEKYGIAPKAVVLLASARPVAESERDATDTYAPNAATEFDLMNAGAEDAFALSEGFDEDRFDDKSNANNSWIVRQYHTDALSFPVFSLSAPSSDPDKRRANSADTYEFFFNRFAVQAGSSLLLATSQIYVPYQQLEAVRTLALPHQVSIETIGFPPEWGGSLQGMVGPTNYLQETRSTIQSADRFIKAFPR